MIGKTLLKGASRYMQQKVKEKVPPAVRSAAANAYAAVLINTADGITFGFNSVMLNKGGFVKGASELILTLAYPPYNKSLVIVNFPSADEFKAAFQRQGLENVFKKRLVEAGVNGEKPIPEVYLKSKELHYQPKSANYVAIEDTPSGVRSAKAAGMRCIALLTTTDYQELKEAGADVIIPDFLQLVKILKRTALF
jgi:beta-phosphoglucomutase-like phosphatase (HAD superfamily)